MRPIRNLIEKGTSSVPRGPLGFLGKGNAVGAVNYFVVSAINGVIPIDGLEVGFNIESHSVDRSGDEDVHTFVVNSANKDVARFAAKFKAAPSNIDFTLQDTEVESVEALEERSTFTTWEIIVLVEERE